MIPGVLEERHVPSRSKRGVEYLMVRFPGGWSHADLGCERNIYRRDNDAPCHHIQILNEEYAMTTAVTEHRDLPALIDEFNTQLIVEGVAPEIVEKWAYSFRMGRDNAEGLSILGVQAAVREAARRGGEVIRCLGVELKGQTDREAFFIATAARYAVRLNPETGQQQEVMLDQTIRAKRVSKYIALRSGGEQFNDNWYEHGVTKAARNVENAMLTDETRGVVMAAAREARVLVEAMKRGGGAQVRQATTQTPRGALLHAAQMTLIDLKAAFPDVYAETLAKLKAAYPEARNAQGSFILGKLTDAQLAVANDTVTAVSEEANGGAPPSEAEPPCGECGEPSVMEDSEGNFYCAEHVVFVAEEGDDDDPID